ncbi:hypothetical protein [Streptomyces murinus]|uniref:Uncharacterized protein n=1 Tax=Streptomyces murinus TaxID=33900 RepID=A0A7W3NHZ3_STRMR|nr:hypothetical protein [Streptomyces murinus]MBA9050856.1 hypothetical protein [Streptomyces murinus]
MDAADNDGHTTGPDACVHNEISGGHVAGGLVQAGVVRELHIHGAHASDGTSDDPIIATVESRPASNLTPLTVVVDDDPPREVVRSSSVYSILVQARTTWAVTLRAMRAVVVERRRPLPACIQPPRFGAILPPRPFTADFDTDPPRLTALEADFPFTVSSTEVEQFDILPQVTKDQVFWFLEIDWTCQENRGTTVVGDPGAPFEIYPARVLRDREGHPSPLNSGCDEALAMTGAHVPGCPTERLVALRRAGAVPQPDPGLAKAELETEFPNWSIWRSEGGRWYGTSRQSGLGGGGTVGADSPNSLRILLDKRRNRHGMT